MTRVRFDSRTNFQPIQAHARVGWFCALFVGLVVAPGCRSDAPREVLIYYANETSPEGPEAENYRVIIDWLRASTSDRGRSIAQGLQAELEQFSPTVDDEIQALRQHAPDCDPPLPTLVFTNRLARQGEFLRLDPGRDSRFVNRSMPVLANDNYIVAANPLSQRGMLQQALKVAAQEFDPHRHRFVLITKSHGGNRWALTVRLSRRHEEISQEQLLQSLESVDSVATPAEIGTTKDEYFSLLQSVGDNYGMNFSLVFMESCQGTFDAAQRNQLPTNVDLLYASGNRYLAYSTLDYPEFLRGVSGDRSASAALDEALAPHYLALFRAGNWRSKLLPGLWSAPLIVWVVILLMRRLRRNRNQRSQVDHDAQGERPPAP